MRRVLFLALLPFCCYSFSCFICEGDDCFSPERWPIVQCPPSTKMCYRLTSSGQVFRRGCALTDCDNMQGIPFRAKCNTCDSEKCNGLRQIYSVHPGGGDTWKTSSQTFFLLPIVGSLLFLL